MQWQQPHSSTGPQRLQPMGCIPSTIIDDNLEKWCEKYQADGESVRQRGFRELGEALRGRWAAGMAGMQVREAWERYKAGSKHSPLALPNPPLACCAACSALWTRCSIKPWSLSRSRPSSSAAASSCCRRSTCSRQQAQQGVCGPGNTVGCPHPRLAPTRALPGAVHSFQLLTRFGSLPAVCAAQHGRSAPHHALT